MSKKSLTVNYVYNLTYQILVIAIPLITTPYLSRVLGAENIGIYSYTLSITTYFILLGTLGIAMYGQREIAYLQNNIDKRSNAFFEILIMRFITSSISLLLFYFCFCIKGQYQIYYKIFILEIFANIIDISWFFQGLEEFKKTVFRNTLVKLISIFCIFLFVKSKNDLGIYIFIYVLSNFIGNLSLWIYLPKYVSKINLKRLNICRHIKPTLGLFIPQIAVQVYTILDKTMIGLMISDKAEVGFYEQAQKIIKLLLTLATSLGTIMIPRMANTYAKKDFTKLKKYMLNSFSFIMMLAFPLMFGIMSISYKFVPIFYGSGFEKVTLLIYILSPIIIIIGLNNIIGAQYLVPTNQQKKYTISVVCGAGVNFFLNLLLIPHFKSIGASFATVIAELTVTCIQFYFIKQEIKFKQILKLSYKYFISAVVMFLFSSIVGIFIQNEFISIIIQIFVSIVSYTLVLIMLNDEFFIILRNMFLAKFKEKIKI